MIRMSKNPMNEILHAAIVVAFDMSSGRVHGTFVHASYGKPDEAGIRRSRERLLSELRNRVDSGTTLDAIDLPLAELGDDWIEHVDPETRKPVIRHGGKLP